MTKYKKHKIIEEFISGFSNYNTQKSYRGILNEYFREIKVKKPDIYFDGKQNIKSDIEIYCNFLTTQSPKSFATKMGALKTFFTENEKEFPSVFVSRFKKRNIGASKPITRDLIPRKEELYKLLQHTDIRGKALFLLLASSGMRIGEALQLKIKDIEFDYKPTKDISITKIDIRREYTKNKCARITFISTEATEFFKEWLSIRDDYIRKNQDTAQNLYVKEVKSINDKRIFPYSTTATFNMFNKMRKSSGFTEKSGDRYKIHIHSLRKFFRTNLPIEMKVDMVEELMGHEGYLTNAYREYQDYTLAEAYYNSQHLITIFQSGVTPKDMKDIEFKLNVREQDINDLQEQRLNQKKQIEDLQNLVAIYTNEVSDLKKQLEDKK